MGFGVSFLGDDEHAQGREKQFQQAVEILSMRVPRIVGGGALAPAPLLQAPGGAGSPFAQSAIQQAMAQMAGLPQQGSPMGGGMAPMGMSPQRMPTRPMQPQASQPRMQAPTPRIIPGLDQLGAPPPQAAPTREWTQPDQQISGPLVGTPTGELQTAAERSSQGYNNNYLQDMLRNWGSNQRGFL